MTIPLSVMKDQQTSMKKSGIACGLFLNSSLFFSLLMHLALHVRSNLATTGTISTFHL